MREGEGTESEEFVTTTESGNCHSSKSKLRNLSQKHCFGFDLICERSKLESGQIQVVCSQVQFGLGNAEAIELLSENFSQLCFGFGSSNQSTD